MRILSFRTCPIPLAVALALTATLNLGAETVTTVGPHQYLQANGTPLFAIACYGLPKGMEPSEGKAMGFNLLRSGADVETLNTYQKAGLYAWVTLGGPFDMTGSEQDIEKKKTQMKQVVAKVGNHPALIMWESIDEPAWTDDEPAKSRNGYKAMEAGYKYLRTLETNHPVYLNHAPRNTVETLRKYSTGCDIVCVDIYPIIPKGIKKMFAITPDGRQGDLPNQTPSCVGEYVDKMKKAAYPGQPVFIVLQGFSWEMLRPENERDPNLILFPTYEESRFMAWNAIIHGANGLVYWGLHYTPKDNPLVDHLSKVLNEIRDLEPIILGREPLHKPVLRYAERGSTITAGVETMLREVNGVVYMAAANTSIDPAGATFEALPEPFSTCSCLEVLGENRTIAIEGNAFHDEFDGLGVHIYKGNPE
ncbi:MAG: hypothetical protein ABIH23_23810 [bacterium]